MKYKEVIKEGMEMIHARSNALFLGYNVKYGGMGDGSLKDIPTKYLIETPVAENLMMSMATGISLEGFLPVLYYERFDFILNALDAMVNHLDKIDLMSHGEFKPKVIIRAIQGGVKKPFFTGATHIQDFSEELKTMVSFKVVKLPSDYKGIMKVYQDALKSDKSTLIIEEKDMYDEIVD